VAAEKGQRRRSILIVAAAVSLLMRRVHALVAHELPRTGQNPGAVSSPASFQDALNLRNIREGGAHVTMSREMCERLTAGKHTPERCVEVAFRFLLDREPKESILGRFDVTAISRYFPEFEREMPRYFSRF